jgi:hypothetical protein
MRVIAIQSSKDGNVKSFGEGELLGKMVPDKEPFKTVGLTNPCIKLDSGKYVWGFESWWGAKEEVQKQMLDSATSVEIVEPSNIQPIQTT